MNKQNAAYSLVRIMRGSKYQTDMGRKLMRSWRRLKVILSIVASIRFLSNPAIAWGKQASLWSQTAMYRKNRFGFASSGHFEAM